ncbi:hypothetical protein L873DRAFT_1040586 [Choiromyces venosus 120613-1]|uniref:Uncharacterized protein n=1 Tax=Choiromyces venosus 120613-1 TaxID=1336337 RepID=A0A3N4JM49_9PEZI|nr:hypothetical protein L873DRAFT_1040586 [Choiromyces venosus 120613-1]
MFTVIRCCTRVTYWMLKSGMGSTLPSNSVSFRNGGVLVPYGASTLESTFTTTKRPQLFDKQQQRCMPLFYLLLLYNDPKSYREHIYRADFTLGGVVLSIIALKVEAKFGWSQGVGTCMGKECFG